MFELDSFKQDNVKLKFAIHLQSENQELPKSNLSKDERLKPNIKFDPTYT